MFTTTGVTVRSYSNVSWSAIWKCKSLAQRLMLVCAVRGSRTYVCIRLFSVCSSPGGEATLTEPRDGAVSESRTPPTTAGASPVQRSVRHPTPRADQHTTTPNSPGRATHNNGPNSPGRTAHNNGPPPPNSQGNTAHNNDPQRLYVLPSFFEILNIRLPTFLLILCCSLEYFIT